MFASRVFANFDQFEVIFDNFLDHFGRYRSLNQTNIANRFYTHKHSLSSSTTTIKSNGIKSYNFGSQLTSRRQVFYAEGKFLSKKRHIHQIWQFRFFTYPLNEKRACSLKKILFKKPTFSTYCSSTKSMYDINDE